MLQEENPSGATLPVGHHVSILPIDYTLEVVGAGQKDSSRISYKEIEETLCIARTRWETKANENGQIYIYKRNINNNTCISVQKKTSTTPVFGSISLVITLCPPPTPATLLQTKTTCSIY
ncbi:uncharacterized protein G2W53_041211 [Senna tora]|uniref:Uncharacterized protein n=1 Tax=Senna tora TaxID=362788 RepID=A0A834VZ02_9FABA|nr:uncharacterized protein G2W53_041211 [Senna tora]